MYRNMIIVKVGEIHLKGLNRPFFEKTLIKCFLCSGHYAKPLHGSFYLSHRFYEVSIHFISTLQRRKLRHKKPE